MATSIDGEDWRSLAQELATAISSESLPSMWRALMRAAQRELRAWEQGSSARGLVIARHAVSEWHRWRSQLAPAAANLE